MKDFIFDNPVKIYFGKDAISFLSKTAATFGKTALVLYGGGSVKQNGVLQAVINELEKGGISCIEFGGIEPNPRITTIRKAIGLARERKVDFIVAAGGGSVMDAAKCIAGGFYYDGDAWDFMAENRLFPSRALPILCVPTLSATGSEMNNTFVISKWETNEKLSCKSDLVYPKASFLNPIFTFSVNAYQTACGSIDIMSHVFETYFDANRGAFLSDRLCEAVLKTVIHYAPVAIEKPDDFDARSNLMWAGSVALNGILKKGKKGMAWAVHGMEHQLSGVYDIAHGAGLSIITPAWFNFCLKGNEDKFFEYAVNVWGIKSDDKITAARQAIEKTKAFFASLGAPVTLSEVSIDGTHFKMMSERAYKNSRTQYAFVPMTAEDIENVYKECL